MTTEGGSLLIKPALPAEVAFYQTVLNNEEFASLREYVPQFMGTLRLEGQIDPAQSEQGAIAVTADSADAMKEDERDSIVLENVAHRFVKPNIIDIKLGKVLYDEDASEEKRARMIKTALATTSHETGVRLTGFQTYDVSRGVAINTPKSYGKTIKAADLPEGFARFFRLSPRPSSRPPTQVEEKGKGKHIEGAAAAEDPEEALRGTGLPSDLLLPLLRFLRDDIAEIRDALAKAELRMVGASLLIVYEADWERCREGIKYYSDGPDEDEVDDDDEDEDEDESSKRPHPYVVKLIDFAHTRLVPGQGPDEGLLAGVDTVLKLIDGRIREVDVLRNAATSTDA